MNKKDQLKQFPELMGPAFQISRLMEGLDMKWVIDGSGIMANICVDVQSTTHLIKLIIDANDMSQIPYDYLISGQLPEREVLHPFCNLLRRDGVLVDIGANIGWYSLLAAATGALAYAFEPIPSTYERLCKNIELNDYVGIKPFFMGLGEKSGLETFYYHQNVSGASSRANLDYLSDGMSQPVKCPINTLDSICKRENIERIDLIKCDVEGGELFVYRGAIETLRRFRPFVLSEMLRKWSAKFSYHPNEIIKLFADMDYICIALSRKQPGKGYILECMSDETEETNFLFAPAEKESMIRSLMVL